MIPIGAKLLKVHPSSKPSLPDRFTSPPITPCAEIVPVSTFFSWRQALLAQGGEQGALDWLLDAAAGLSRSRLQLLRLHPNSSVHLHASRKDLEQLWIRHLTESVPLQYLVGQCHWRNTELEVSPAVLIPRPETEAMVDLGVALMQRVDGLWADLGTGSGCLAIGLARELPKGLGFAVDISSEALDLARRNLERAGLATCVHVIQGDWLGALKPWWGQFQLIVANPPYIPSKEVAQLDAVVRDHEPHLALDGGADGLVSIRSIARQAPRALAPGGWLLLEHHHDQSAQVLDLLATNDLVDGQCHQDLEGRWRFASARRRPDHDTPIPWLQP